MTEWTPSLVEERPAEASYVLMHLPEEEKVQGHFSTWPTILYEFSDFVGQEPKPMRVLPSPAAMSRMEETFSRIAGLDPINGKIVWMRACGKHSKTICWTFGLQRSAAHENWRYALCVIAWCLNQRRVPKLRSRRYVIETVRQVCDLPEQERD